MADNDDGVPHPRHKSLVDIGKAMGVFGSNPSLPNIFEAPILPPTEELHLTPRETPVIPPSPVEVLEPHQENPVLEETAKDQSAESTELETKEDSPAAAENGTSVPSSTVQTDNAPAIILPTSPEKPSLLREALFEPTPEPKQETTTSSKAGDAVLVQRPVRGADFMPTVARQSFSIDGHPINSRFAHLGNNTGYSQTSPAPRTSASPFAGVSSFFSKLFTPNQDSAPIADTSSAQNRPPSKGQAHSNDPDHASSHIRTTSDQARTLNSTGSQKFLSTRMASLPPKSEQEEAKHREQYLAMMQAFEAKEAENKQKQDLKQKAKDTRIMLARTTWTHDILPHWEKKKRTKPVHDLVLQGIPPGVRTRVWPMLVGNDLHINKDLFNIYVKQSEVAKTQRAAGIKVEQVGKLASASLIGVDLPRTFPALAFYQEGGPNHAELHRVLDAYVCYRPDIGYVQGMSYLAAILLLYLDDVTAFSCLANLLNRNVHMAFYKMDVELQQYVSLFEALFKRTLPDLYAHFEHIGISSEMYLLDWFLTLFSKSLPLDVATHLWDIYIFEGQAFLFRAALGLLKYIQAPILSQELDLVPCKHILARFPEEHLDEDAILASIASIHLNEHEALLEQLQISLFHL